MIQMQGTLNGRDYTLKVEVPTDIPEDRILDFVSDLNIALRRVVLKRHEKYTELKIGGSA